MESLIQTESYRYSLEHPKSQNALILRSLILYLDPYHLILKD